MPIQTARRARFAEGMFAAWFCLRSRKPHWMHALQVLLEEWVLELLLNESTKGTQAFHLNAHHPSQEDYS
jgi:hypothetical protein